MVFLLFEKYPESSRGFFQTEMESLVARGTHDFIQQLAPPFRR